MVVFHMWNGLPFKSRLERHLKTSKKHSAIAGITSQNEIPPVNSHLLANVDVDVEVKLLHLNLFKCAIVTTCIFTHVCKYIIMYLIMKVGRQWWKLIPPVMTTGLSPQRSSHCSTFYWTVLDPWYMTMYSWEHKLLVVMWLFHTCRDNQIWSSCGTSWSSWIHQFQAWVRSRISCFLDWTCLRR